MLPLQGTQVQPLVRELKSHKANFWASLVAQLVKNLPAMWETWIQSLGWEDPLEEGKATPFSILACFKFVPQASPHMLILDLAM